MGEFQPLATCFENDNSDFHLKRINSDCSHAVEFINIYNLHIQQKSRLYVSLSHSLIAASS